LVNVLAVDQTDNELRLDVERHEYWLGKVRLPSVTQALSVIESFDHIPADVLERARLFGRHCHTMIDLFNKGELDEETLDPELALYLAQYKRFLFETNLEVTQSEERVCSRSLGYAGTLDIRGILGVRVRRYSLIDLKSGAVPRSVGPQTAAYQQACNEKPPRRYALQLARDRFKLIPCEDPSDFSNFLSALNVYRFQRRSFSHVAERG
jgi:hypothetical protein